MCSECNKQVDLVNIRPLGKCTICLFIKPTQSLTPVFLLGLQVLSHADHFALFGNKLILPDQLTYFPWVILCSHGFPYPLYITASCVPCNKKMTWYLGRWTQFPDVRHHSEKQGSKHAAEHCLNNTARYEKAQDHIMYFDNWSLWQQGIIKYNISFLRSLLFKLILVSLFRIRVRLLRSHMFARTEPCFWTTSPLGQVWKQPLWRTEQSTGAHNQSACGTLHFGCACFRMEPWFETAVLQLWFNRKGGSTPSAQLCKISPCTQHNVLCHCSAGHG